MTTARGARQDGRESLPIHEVPVSKEIQNMTESLNLKNVHLFWQQLGLNEQKEGSAPSCLGGRVQVKKGT